MADVKGEREGQAEVAKGGAESGPNNGGSSAKAVEDETGMKRVATVVAAASAKAAHAGNSNIHVFYVFNADIKVSETTQYKKLLYYQPADTPLERQVRAIGLSEALISFTRNFSPDEACESVQTKRVTYSYFEAEPGTWFCVGLRNRVVDKKSKTKSESSKGGESSGGSGSSQSGDAQKNYHVGPSVARALLERAYAQFRLFYGSLSQFLMDGRKETLRNLLAHFIPSFLACVDTSTMTLEDTLNGFRFLPLHTDVFLYAQSTINLIESSFPILQHSALLYKENLVWSDLEQEDMRAVYQWLLGHIYACREGVGFSRAQKIGRFPYLLAQAGQIPLLDKQLTADHVHVDESAKSEAQSKAGENHVHRYPKGQFICGLPIDAKSKPTLPFVHLVSDIRPVPIDATKNLEPKNKEVLSDEEHARIAAHYMKSSKVLLVYRYGDLMYIALVEAADLEGSLDMLRSIQSCLCKQLQALIPAIHASSLGAGESVMVKSETRILTGSSSTGNSGSGSGSTSSHVSSDEYRFLYFNRMSLVIKSSLLRNDHKTPPISAAEFKLINQMHKDLSNPRSKLSQLVVRTEYERWIVARNSDCRELFIIVPAKDKLGALRAVEDYFQLVNRSQFGGSFL